MLPDRRCQEKSVRGSHRSRKHSVPSSRVKSASPMRSGLALLMVAWLASTPTVAAVGTSTPPSGPVSTAIQRKHHSIETFAC